MEHLDNPYVVCGVGDKWGAQYRQGNRVYSSNAIAMCCVAQPLGNLGGYSYLYLEIKNERDKND